MGDPMSNMDQPLPSLAESGLAEGEQSGAGGAGAKKPEMESVSGPGEAPPTGANAGGEEGVLQAGSVTVARFPEFPKYFGLTIAPWNARGGKITPPVIDFTVEEGENDENGVAQKVVRFKPTDCDEPTHPAWAMPAGKFQFGEEREGSWRKWKLVTIGEDVAADIKAAEQEHISDLDRAFDMVYQEVTDQINELANAKTPFSGVTVDEAKKNALDALAGKYHNGIGVTKEEWDAAFRALGELTQELRDNASPNTHLVEGVQVGEPTKDYDYKIAKFWFKAVSKIKLKPTSSVIRWSNVK